MSTFAIAARDELWQRGRCTDARLEHGTARSEGLRIVASDARDEELVDIVNAAIEPMRSAAAAIDDCALRLVVSARRVRGTIVTSAIATISRLRVSVVSSAHDIRESAAFLKDVIAEPFDANPAGLPMVWLNGSGAVLLHEAVGHPAEETDHRGAEVPEWLTVRDEPEIEVDDCGFVPRAVDLLREAPTAWRRESFRDVPLQRMTTLVARQNNAPFTMPDDRIEIHLLGGGRFDPVYDSVELHVSVADLVRHGMRTRLRPFTIARPRIDMLRSIEGALGEPVRYPGVICSREGQDVFVESFAPLLVTR